MKPHSIPVFLTLGVALSVPLHADLIATEYFNGYGTVETNALGLDGGTGWISNWANGGGVASLPNDNEYRPASLSYSAAGYDNSANLNGSEDGALYYDADNTGTSFVVRSLTPSASTVWMSALISVSGDTGDRATLWPDAVANVNNGNSGDGFGILDGNVFFRHNGNTSTGSAPAAGVYLIVGKAEIDVSGSNDRLSFWFDPDVSSGEAGLGPATFTADNADTFGTAINGVGVLNKGAGALDAIRVGETLGDVIASLPPAPPEVTSITKAGDTVTIDFTGAEGASYGLNKSANLDFTTPNIVDTAVVSGGTGTLEDTAATDDASFYRVESQ
ncbi:hypothetical protein [Haloferula sp. A504]|uniref:hypothetical protein n=1 Tax=Haloferula sp. A504 TaxID=3373601 RepID=UPI0031C48B26|nr:hypothetical protein [Verrucomicrobiaceae bacterium E54]